MEFDLVICGGTVFSMLDDAVPSVANVAVQDGKIAAILPQGEPFRAKKTFDATGMFVTPGFIDSHVHDEFFEDPDTVQHAMLRQGVTTAIAGQCGDGPLFEKSYQARKDPWINLSFLVGASCLRKEAGHEDRYTEASPQERARMCELLEESLEKGAMGLSLGLQYEPGSSYEEVAALAAVVSKYKNRVITVHTRFADTRSVDSVKEGISLARDYNVHVQISHLASQSMWYTKACIETIEEAIAEGIDVGFDCYPYDAFCTYAGSTVFDDGFVERWRGKGPEYLEAVSGKFTGQRLTWETLKIMREEEPMALIAGYVLNPDEVEMCLTHPKCIVVSDGLYTGGGAHPRIAGTFPRVLNILIEQGFTWTDALKKITTMPADLFSLDAGRLRIGGAADITVFHPQELRDEATFYEPFKPASGIKLIVVNGKVALENGALNREKQGRFFFSA